MSIFRNTAAFDRGQARHDNACPDDDEGGWEGCDLCNATGCIGSELCDQCGGAGGQDTATGEPVAYSEYLRRERRAREDALSH